MKSTPLIMSTPMMQAYLDGRKKMTRRLNGLEVINENPGEWELVEHDYWLFENIKTGKRLYIKCPFGVIGDGLWFRETHYRWGYWIKNGKTKTGRQKRKFKALSDDIRFLDGKPTDSLRKYTDNTVGWYKRPAIFMPKWACRAKETLTNIRLERLQDITEIDAIKEGLIQETHTEFGATTTYWARNRFKRLWDKLNAKRGYSWENNPWNWVLEWK